MSEPRKAPTATEVQTEDLQPVSGSSAGSSEEDEEALVPSSEEQSSNEKTLSSKRALWGWLVLCFSVSSIQSHAYPNLTIR